MQDNQYKELLYAYSSMLSNTSPTPYLDALCIMTGILDCSQSTIYTNPQKYITPAEKYVLDQAFEARILGKPVAYIIKSKAFWKFNLFIQENCFIPRDDTECLVEKVLSLTQASENIKVLELGTGSGAISLALAYERPNWHITAVDINLEALDIARKNAKKYNIDNVNFLESNWYSNVQDCFNIVISNPPYIAFDEAVDIGVTFEPASSLFSSDQGLADLKHIIEGATKYPGCFLILEHSPQQQNSIVNYLKINGYTNIENIEDLSGSVRGVSAYAIRKN